MADNSTQGGADTIRDKDRAGVKTQIVGLDLGIGTGSESLMSGTMPVTPASTGHRIAVTPTISTTPAYSIGDALGGLQTLATGITSGGLFVIDTVTVLDLAKLDVVMDIVFFDQSFTAGTDNALFDPSDADAANVLGVVSVNAGHYADFNDWSVACLRNVGLAGKLSGSANLYCQAVIRQAATYVSTTDLKFIYTLREV